uniref:Uncharacterized protein n=1 Tax=Acrobeloides nanus TaxID=290746 RepID=A0A914EIX2_9BILA
MASLRPPAKLFDNGFDMEDMEVREMDPIKRQEPQGKDLRFVNDRQNGGESFDNIRPGTSDYMKRDLYTEPAGDTKELRAKVRLENQNSFD